MATGVMIRHLEPLNMHHTVKIDMVADDVVGISTMVDLLVKKRRLCGIPGLTTKGPP